MYIPIYVYIYVINILMRVRMCWIKVILNIDGEVAGTKCKNYCNVGGVCLFVDRQRDDGRCENRIPFLCSSKTESEEKKGKFILNRAQ